MCSIEFIINVSGKSVIKSLIKRTAVSNFNSDETPVLNKDAIFPILLSIYRTVYSP